jgi:hypothetical protein
MIQQLKSLAPLLLLLVMLVALCRAVMSVYRQQAVPSSSAR